MDEADLTEVLRTTRELVRERVIPHEAEIDATDEMPAGLRQEAARLGLFGSGCSASRYPRSTAASACPWRRKPGW
jgi:alkylation response protein AidB-like acyl-CoA dehydrogenase